MNNMKESMVRLGLTMLDISVGGVSNVVFAEFLYTLISADLLDVYNDFERRVFYTGQKVMISKENYHKLLDKYLGVDNCVVKA